MYSEEYSYTNLSVKCSKLFSDRLTLTTTVAITKASPQVQHEIAIVSSVRQYQKILVLSSTLKISIPVYSNLCSLIYD